MSYYFSSRLITLVPYALVYAMVFLACAKWLKLLSDEDRALLSQLLPGGLRKIAAHL